MRIGIVGAAGRMGRMVAEECRHRGLTVAGGTIRPGQAMAGGIEVFADIAALAAEADVIIDFTRPETVSGHSTALAQAHIAWVIGTTGVTPSGQKDIRTAAKEIVVVQAANFSAGVAIVLEAARQLARSLPSDEFDAEILEMHHRQKVDAPSGTALALGHAVVAGRAHAGERLDVPARVHHGSHDRSGVRQSGAIGYASLRGGQVVGRHSLIFAGASEQITLSHEATDRRVFAAGAVRAALWTKDRPPGLYGMNDVLGIKVDE